MAGLHSWGAEYKGPLIAGLFCDLYVMRLDWRTQSHKLIGRGGMAELAKTSGQSYYDVMPALDLSAGDIWTGLPTFGHLGRDLSMGLVITPACDLSNNKVETVTYLPVISVRDYMLGRGFSAEMVRVVKAQASVAGLGSTGGWQLRGVNLPATGVMQATLVAASEVLKSQAGMKQKSAAERVSAAVSVLLALRLGGNEELETVKVALGRKEYGNILKNIIRNSYSSDIHFLPSDGRVGDYSAMESHSVALFRYPMSLPVELLISANDIGLTDWSGVVRSFSKEFPIVNALRSCRPVKVAALRPRFLPDVISRFAALHVRMGSPDFTDETVEDFILSFEGG